MKYAKVGKSEKQCLFKWELWVCSSCNTIPWPVHNCDWLKCSLLFYLMGQFTPNQKYIFSLLPLPVALFVVVRLLSDIMELDGTSIVVLKAPKLFI